MKNIKIVLALSIITLIVILISCQSNQGIFKFATGSTGGTYYPIGSAIAEILTDKMPNKSINSYTGNASVSNCRLIEQGEIDMALAQSNVSYWAYTSKGMFEGESLKSIRGIASLYSEAIQIIVRKDKEIKSIKDLEGMRVNLGQKSSGIYFDAVTILKVYGLDENQIEGSYLDFKGAMEAIERDEIDATFITSGIPTTSVITMGNNVSIDLISIDEVEREILKENQTYYTDIVIPANTYPGVDYDVHTLAPRALWICNENLSEDDVYNMTKILWENNEKLIKVHSQGKEIILKTSISGMSIPLHPGALKYYEEMGISIKKKTN